MKLEINEVGFLREAINTVTIKASDAPNVASVMSKLDKEFNRLVKIEDKKAEAAEKLCLPGKRSAVLPTPIHT